MKIELKTKRKLTKKINGQEFHLTPYINLTQKEFILNKLFEYYEENRDNTFVDLISGFRAILDVLVLKATTDIDTDNLEYDDVLSSGLIELIRDSVINYNEIYQDSFYFLQINLLGKLFPDVESLFGSFGNALDKLNEMSPEQKQNLEMVVRASMANSAASTIFNSSEGGK